MEQNWYSVDECLPFMYRTFPMYEKDKRMSSYHEFIVRGLEEDTEWNDELKRYQQISYWIYSVARLMHSYDYQEKQWSLKWDTQSDVFWGDRANKITHWTDLGNSHVSTILDDICEDE